mmetsp:Transcript_11041/g.26063  ORF Transcript_11041/g.26063 Transcript_11041/m.26063 type:complete len:337 (-) Transcript_11041:91-1101(-)
MGNTKSSESTLSRGSPLNHERDQKKAALAMMAVARKISLQKGHIVRLRNAMSEFSDDVGTIPRKGFDEALELANLPGPEVFDLLFTMWENADKGKVSSKAFCCGVSPLACPFDDLSSIIQFALSISDDSHRGHTNKKELYELLLGINSTASYFGDPHLLTREIEIIVDTVFAEGGEQNRTDCVRKLAMNPYVKRFALGKKRLNVRFKEALVTEYVFDKDALVTEYVLDNIEALIISSTCNSNAHTFEVGESRDDIDLSRGHQPRPTEDGNATPLLDERESFEYATVQNRNPPTSDDNDNSQVCAELRDPPSRHSYSTYQRTSSMQMSRDPPSSINE